MKNRRFTVLIGCALVLIMIWAVSRAPAFAGLQNNARVVPARAAAPWLGRPASPVSGGFTYQGQLTGSNGPVNLPCDFQFGLWDAPNAGVQVGITQTLDTVNVVDGLFTVPLDFGPDAFGGDSRWLAVGVRCPAGNGDFTALSPRQPLTAAPYALYAAGNWGLHGNTGAGANSFLGTTDNTPLVLGANNAAILRLVPNPVSPVIIGGYGGNVIGGSADGAVIAGGGYYWEANVISGTNVTYAVISGGVKNKINGYSRDSTIGGGHDNTINGANSEESTIGGGSTNTIDGDNEYQATISGGFLNGITGPDAHFGTIGGGEANHVMGIAATIPGGFQNTAFGDYSFAAGANAHADHTGTFVWTCASCGSTHSTGPDQFIIGAPGGVGVNTNAPARSLDVNGVIGVMDNSAHTYYGGLASEVSSSLVEMGLNDDATNRFGGAYDSTAQGGLLRVDGRPGSDLFSFYGRPAGSTTLSLLAALDSSGVMTVNGLGSAGSTTLCYNAAHQIAACSSSLRYKDHVADLPLGLETINRLRPITFTWKADGAADLGFAAEEVNQVSPLLTTLNQYGQVEGVKYDRISAVLVKAVQEQQQQIEDLKAQNAAQQQEIARLQGGARTSQPFSFANLLSLAALVGVSVIGLRQRRAG